MRCEQVRELLGPFHDGELGPADEASVAAHLDGCAACANELAAIAELGELARSLPNPEPPEFLWGRIERRLERRTPARWVAAVAAVILLAVAVGWFARRQPHGADVLIKSLGAAQPVSLQEAARQVDFRLVSMNDLAGDYRLHECCLCSDGCCDMVRCKYRRGADEVVLVQGPADRPLEFGGRPAVETTVGGRRVCVVRCGRCLAATWRRGDTSFALVGPRDLEELGRLVAAVDEKP